jgi:hypothetical protein
VQAENVGLVREDALDNIKRDAELLRACEYVRSRTGGGCMT